MNILFPHEKVRETQKEFIEKIEEAIENKTSLLAHCPTGTGKTAAVLSVALASAIEKKLTVFFITPRHTQHKIAIETLRMIKEKYSTDFAAVDLIGKKWMCAQPAAAELSSGEFYDYCKDLVKNSQCAFYENVRKDNIVTLETKETLRVLNNQIMHVEELKEYTKKRMLCPFEVACLIAKRASVIIADYHHILSPTIRDTLLEKLKKDLSECIIIIDEAHNLPERCRELLSSQTSTLALEYSAREAESLGYKDMSETLREVKRRIEELAGTKISREERESLITKQEFNEKIDSIISTDQIIDDLYSIGEKIIETKKKSHSTALAGFLLNWQGKDNGFIRLIKLNKTQKGRDYIAVEYKCLDPSLITRPLADNSYSLVCMSGTLNPLEMYKDLLGFKAIASEFPNPFPEKNKLTIIVPETTTKFTARSPEMFERIADHCTKISDAIPGNSIMFFPSYKIRDEINSRMQNKCAKTIFTETQNMTKQEKTEFLERFKSYKNIGAVLLGVSGGNFGEGVDIEKNILKCVTVVGIPLERPDLETRELIKYYDEKFSKGWDYGYIMPAIIKSLQNAGRCIRSETDKGVIIFLDQRYIWDSYFKCFPKDNNLRITKEPLPKIKEFFENHGIGHEQQFF